MILDRVCIATPAGPGPSAGRRQGEVTLIPDAAILVRGGVIAALGPRDVVLPKAAAGEPGLELGGRAVVPGLVDAHTHLVWAGDRIGELEQRAAGASYGEIAAAGGGIAKTVRETRAADRDRLAELLRVRLEALATHGVTTVEAKTGYGLSTEAELLHLDLLAEADATHPVHVVQTFLGAHAVPEEYADRREVYVELVIETMLPRVAEAHPDAFCDVFCDTGAFTLEETSRILGRARELGLRLKAHSDEFANLGCTALAAELGAASVDHLVATPVAEMEAMAVAGTVAVLLPGTTVGLGSTQFANAREMIGRGVPVALGTDFNPGTCPSPNLPFIMGLAVRYLRLSPAEALTAATVNAAAASGCHNGAGRLVEGGPSDLAVVDAEDYRGLVYELGTNPIHAVMIGGEWVRPPAI